VSSSALRGHERERERALARIVALHRRLGAQHWFSHDSAALVWGLPLWRLPTTTHVIHEHRRGLGADPAVTWHFSRPAQAERAVASGLPVTSLERTAVDCATSLDPLGGLVVADAALRAGAPPERIAELLRARVGSRGIRAAREVLALADGGAESPGETATRFVLLRAGLPVPTTQVHVPTRLGSFWSDLGWVEWRLLVEYDGKAKYGADPEALLREKRRHDAVVEAGWRVVRVTRDDLAAGDVVERVVRHLPPGILLAPRRFLR
jgi:very-short-patch-repair endonuclease